MGSAIPPAMRWRFSTVRPAPGFVEPCLPTISPQPPTGAGWAYEIKHDGYRLLVRRSGATVRIYTRRGVDWTARFPRIVEAVRRLKVSSVLLDGEGVVCDDDGLAIFSKLHSKLNDPTVVMFAFDVLEVDGDDMRPLPLIDRKAKLRRLLARTKDGIYYNDHLVEDGSLVYEHACKLGCEGIVAKKLDRPYRSGRVKSWLKIKNPKSPAMMRVDEGTF